MGKLRALRLGITKGVSHNPITAVAAHRLSGAVEKVTKKMICTNCRHSSNAHTRRYPEFVPMTGRQILEMLVQTRQGANFNECFVYKCDVCEALKCSEIHQ